METEILFENFKKYSSLLKKYFPDEGVDKFLEDFGVRLTTCPRGLTSEEGGDYGALIKHALNVALSANSHSKMINHEIDRKSIARVCLVHEIGKLGSLEEELYVTQESQWHRDKLGQNFKYNEECSKMTASHRTLLLLQHYKIKITQDEWISILTSQGMHFPENSFYGKSLPTTAKILHFAKALNS